MGKSNHLSPSDGERLAAVVALQRQVDAGYRRWLSERLAVEYAFLGYQAAVALRHAAETVADSRLDAVECAANDAARWVGGFGQVGIGRRGMLSQVLAALTARTSRA